MVHGGLEFQVEDVAEVGITGLGRSGYIFCRECLWPYRRGTDSRGRVLRMARMAR